MLNSCPNHYIARERLCLATTADYWVNAMDGRTFFVVSQAVDPYSPDFFAQDEEGARCLLDLSQIFRR
jgi:hypothetical protein